MITYITARAAPGARRAGLVRECVAIAARHRRHSLAWSPHLERCKEHITKAIRLADPAKPVLVLGAGPCLDLPVEALAAHPAGAVLVDAVLLPSTKKLITKHAKLSFVLSDLTGLLAARDTHAALPALAPIKVEGYGLIISANILSQLPLAFVSVPPENTDEKAIMTALQAAHINALKASGIPSMVISDYMAKFIVPSGIKEYNTIDSVIFSTDAIDCWTWAVAPTGELDAQKQLSLTVGVWQINWEPCYD